MNRADSLAQHAVPLSGIERLMELSPHNFEADPGLQLSWDNVLGKSHFRRASVSLAYRS